MPGTYHFLSGELLSAAGVKLEKTYKKITGLNSPFINRALANGTIGAGLLLMNELAPDLAIALSADPRTAALNCSAYVYRYSNGKYYQCTLPK